MIPGCVCMSVGYLAIIVLRNRPSEVGLPDFTSDDDVRTTNDTDINEGFGEYEDEIGLFNKIKMLFSYPFFISICLCYFMVQLIKTLFSDWSQIYLIQNFNLSAYNGKYII